MATTRTSLEDARPSRLPTPRSSMAMDPMSPMSPMTASPLREFARARSPNATPMPSHPTHRVSTSIPSFITRKASGVFAEGPHANSLGSPSAVASKLTAAAAAANKAPKSTISRTAQTQPEKPSDAPRTRTVSGVSKNSTRSHPSPNQPRARVHSLASQSSESVVKAKQEPPTSPTKKGTVLPQPESPVQPSPVKPKPRLSGVSKMNGSPHTVTSPSRPPRKAPGSRQTSNVFPPLSTPSPPAVNNSRGPKPAEQKTVQKVPTVVQPANEMRSTNGSYENDWAPSARAGASGPASEAYDFSGIPLGSEGLPQFRPEDDEMTMELITEVDDGGELDEDVSFWFCC